MASSNCASSCCILDVQSGIATGAVIKIVQQGRDDEIRIILDWAVHSDS